MAIAYTGKAINAINDTSTPTATISVAATDTLIVTCLATDDTTSVINSVEDTAGNTYSVAQNWSSPPGANIWYAIHNGVVEASNVVQWNLALTEDCVVGVYTFSGTDITSPVQKTVSSQSGSGTGDQTITFSADLSDSVIVSCFSRAKTDTVNNYGTGQTQGQDAGMTGANSMHAANSIELVTASGSNDQVCNWNGNTSYSGTAVEFKPLSATDETVQFGGKVVIKNTAAT